MIQSIYLKNMRIEKRCGEVYYICIIPIVNFDASCAAVYNLRWYAEFVGRRLDRSKYTVCLTHKACVLRVRLEGSEYADAERRNLIIKFAEEWVLTVKADFEALSRGEITENIKKSYLEENEAIITEWSKYGETDKAGNIR